jgi:hypothetical protein
MRATFRDHAMSDDGIIGWNCRAPAKNSNARSVIRQRHDAFIVGWMIATIFFPAARATGTTSNASQRCDFVCRLLRAAKFEGMTQSTCHKLLAAQYLSDSGTAYDFVSRR